MVFSHLNVFLEKFLFGSSAHSLTGLFISLILTWMICFCILDINTLSHASFANIFSHSEGCLFCLQVSLICTIFWVYLGPFIYFYFIFISLGGGSRKLLLQSMSKNVLPVFSSKSSIVFSLTFRFLIHFEFIFVCGVKECSSFILSQIVVQFFQHHLLKRLLFFFPFSHCIFLPLLS